jgi:hypothetical protein
MNIEQSASRNEERQIVRVEFEITDAEPSLMWGHGKVRWQPKRLLGHWERDRVNGGAWSRWTFSGSVIGPKVKVDGSPFAGGSAAWRRDRIWGSERGDSPYSAAIAASKPGDGDDLPAPFKPEPGSVDLDG